MIHAWIDLVGVTYPLMNINKRDYNVLNKEWSGIKGLPRYIYIPKGKYDEVPEYFIIPLPDDEYKLSFVYKGVLYQEIIN